MTRVWSLSREETNDNQLYVQWTRNSKLLSFDSGYESSSNSQSTLEFDTNFDAFAESDDYSNVNEENRITEEEPTETTSFLERQQQRVRSSPIPIPRRNKNYGNHNDSKSSLASHRSEESLGASTLTSLESIGSVHCLIGHPPYDCGCVRGYRYPFVAPNLLHSHQSQSNPADPLSPTCAERREGADTGLKKAYYPLPDIISSSQNTTLMNEIIRDIGCDLRRISKDFIATRNPNPSANTRSPKTSAITRLLSLAIPTFIKEVLQLF